tara:strand:+ start:1976 stop:3253 length:1278 start_codon:yes stop_codon:yes gene_type:complete
MKKIISIISLFAIILTINAQESNQNISASFDKNNDYTYNLGSGIEFNFDDSTHLFQIGGMSQPRYLNTRVNDSTLSPGNYFGIKRSYFSLNGSLNKGMFSFLIQTNFSDSYPLLDAWAGYHPNRNMSVYFGQRMSPFNNLSMQIMEYNLQFASRNYLSQNFTESGREFGVFIESIFSLGNIGFKPILAITSGDGKNSFGVLSNDTDQGGLKYGGRLNIYPFGFFRENNEFIGHDIYKEKSHKLMIGFSSSLNQGSSHSVGEGHYFQELPPNGTFMFFDTNGNLKLPNYLKNYVDILYKYKGFNILFEYVNTAAYNLKGTSLNSAGSLLLAPTQISQYLILGNAFNIQGGYLFNSDWSLDFKYGRSYYEFEETYSILQNHDSMGAGITKYFSNRAVKTQLMAAYVNFPVLESQNSLAIECLFQIKF